MQLRGGEVLGFGTWDFVLLAEGLYSGGLALFLHRTSFGGHLRLLSSEILRCDQLQSWSRRCIGCDGARIVRRMSVIYC